MLPERNTYMYSAISAEEGEDVPNDADTERQTLCLPQSRVHPSVKDIFSRPMGTKQRQRQYNSEEAQDMQNQHKAFELLQQGSNSSVDAVTNQYHCPEQERAVPVLHDSSVFRVREQNQTLDHSAGDESAGSYERLPTRDSEPAS